MGEILKELRFTVADSVDIQRHIGSLATELSGVFGIDIDLSGPIKPGGERSTDVYSANNTDIHVSVRDYRKDPKLKGQGVGISVRGDLEVERKFEDFEAALQAYFNGLT